MHFLMASYQQYVHDTAKEVQTSAVNTCQILTQPLYALYCFKIKHSGMHQVKITNQLVKSFLRRKFSGSQGSQEFHLHCM